MLTTDKSILKDLLPQVGAALLDSIVGFMWNTVYIQLLANPSTLMAISDGMTYGWTSPMIPYFMSNQTHIVMTQTNCEWLETINLIGYMAGLPFTVLSVEYLGRKLSMILSAALGCICWILMLLAINVDMLYVGRFFAGVAGDMCFVAAPMYIAEIADCRIRGFLSSFVYLMMIVGILIVYVFGSLTPYWVTPAIGITLTACQTIFVPILPESPYYYMYKNQPEKARKALARVRTNKNVDKELDEIRNEVEREKSVERRPMDLVTVKSNRSGLLITLVLNGAQHFVGVSVFLMNLETILAKAGSVYIQPSTASIIFAVVMLVSTATASTIIDRYGRKFLLIISSSLTGIALLIMTIFFHLQIAGYDVTSVSWIPAACIMAYAATFKVGLGLVPIVIIAEIFPTNVKALGMTIADVTYTVGSVIAISVYQALTNNFGIHVPLYIFTICSFLMMFYAIFCVPETKGKTLDEIQLMLKGESLEKDKITKNELSIVTRL